MEDKCKSDDFSCAIAVDAPWRTEDCTPFRWLGRFTIKPFLAVRSKCVNWGLGSGGSRSRHDLCLAVSFPYPTDSL